MTTSVVLIRHAQSVWNEAGRWQGHADPPLSQTGYAQARALAQRLKSWPIEHLYASDLERARATAGILGESLGLTPVVDPIWRERHIGELQGLTADEIRARFPDIWHRSREDGRPMDAPGGESVEDIQRRAVTAGQRLLENHRGQTVAVVSHGGLIHTLLLHLLQLPSSAFLSLSVAGHTGISVVEVGASRARLTRLNDTAHLELLPV